MNIEGEKLLTVTEVSQLLRVSIRSVRRWAASGRLKSVRIGNLYRFNRASIQEAQAQGLSITTPTEANVN